MASIKVKLNEATYFSPEHTASHVEQAARSLYTNSKFRIPKSELINR